MEPEHGFTFDIKNMKRQEDFPLWKKAIAYPVGIFLLGFYAAFVGIGYLADDVKGIWARR